MLSQRGRGQRAELHLHHRRQSLQVSQHRPERVAAVQVVGAVGADHGDALAVQHAEQERDQVAGGGVRPVQVLEDQQHRGLVRQLGEQAEHRAEHLLFRQPGPVGLPVVAAVAVGQQHGEHRARLDRRLEVGFGGAQRVGERQVRHAVADLRALAGEHGEALARGPGRHLGDQARLTDPRVAADQRGDRMARRRLVQQAGQPAELGGAAD